MRARYYHPGIRRFINQDPIGFDGGLNWYAYAEGNPVSALDPFGLASIDAGGGYSFLDGVQDTLGAAGLAPAVGFFADATNTVIGLTRAAFGDRSWGDVGFDAAAMIPAGGQLATSARFGKRGLNAAKSIDQLSEAGKVIDKGGQLTKAGRAAQKHGGRSSSAFPPTKGNPSAINSQGQDTLDDILTSPKQSTKPNRFGGQDIHAPDGRGARFDSNGNFMGFLEP